MNVLPDVVALCELSARTAADWRRSLRPKGYEFLRTHGSLRARQLRVLLGSRLRIRGLRTRRFRGVRPQALRAGRTAAGGIDLDVYAVHIPNGSQNGWVKIDHLTAIRR